MGKGKASEDAALPGIQHPFSDSYSSGAGGMAGRLRRNANAQGAQTAGAHPQSQAAARLTDDFAQSLAKYV